MLNTLKELCLLNGVSGDEDEVRRYITAKAVKHADHLHADSIGNLIVFKKGAKSTGNRLMLCAHMDEVGVIVTRITDEGFLKFDFVGGVDRRVAIGKPVVIGEKKVPGVIGLKAIHLTTKEERKKAPKTDSLYIDIGARDKESAERLVELGDYGAFVCQPEEFGDGLFKARAIDDRVGCAIMLKLLEEELPSPSPPRRRWVPGGPSARPSLSPRRSPWCWRPPPPPTCPVWRTTAGCAPPARGR